MANEPIKETVVKNPDTTGNPAPLGLLGFGLTTILLSLHNANYYALGSMILAMGIFYGGLAQIIAGIMEWKKNNTFGMVAFTSYGLFWLSLVTLLVLPELGLAQAPSNLAMASYLFLWGLLTVGLFICTLKINRALQVVLGSLAILFFLLAIGDAFASPFIKTVAGYEGIFVGLSAVYTGLAIAINEVYGRTVLPLGAT